MFLYETDNVDVYGMLVEILELFDYEPRLLYYCIHLFIYYILLNVFIY